MSDSPTEVVEKLIMLYVLKWSVKWCMKHCPTLYVHWNSIFAYGNNINEFCNPLFTDSLSLILHCL